MTVSQNYVKEEGNMKGMGKSFLLGLFLVLTSFASALGDKRVALVIGNGRYQHTPDLKNPTNDARDVAAALERLGFIVMLRLDVDKRSFQEAVRDFGVSSRASDVALFYYSGQGIELGGQNW